MPVERHSKQRIGVRRATAKDAIPFLKLEAACFHMRFSRDLLYFWRPVVDYCYAFKAVKGSQIIGGVIAIPTRRRELYINSLFVANRFRRRKIGKILMKRVLSVKSFRGFVLDVKVEKEFVRGFYRKLGFTEIRVMKNYYLDGTDRIIMIRHASKGHRMTNVVT